MADNLNIVLRSKLDRAESIKQISTDITEITKKLGNINIKVNLEGFELVNKKADEVSKKLKRHTITKGSQFINEKVEKQAFSEITARIKEVRQNVDQLASVQIKTGKKGIQTAQITYYNEQLKQTVTETMGWTQAQKKVNGELRNVKTFETQTTKYTDNIAKATAETNKLAQAKEKEQSQHWVQRRKETVQAMTQQNSELVRMKKHYEEVAKQANQLAMFKQKMLGGDGLRGEIDIFSSKHSLNKTQKSQLATLKKDIKGLNSSSPELNKNLQTMQNRFSLLKQEAAQSGNAMTRALDGMVKFLRFYLLGGLLVRFIGSLRTAITTVVELDKQLTQLRKVTGESLQTMDEFARTANDIAINMGASTSAVIEATTAFARLGYSIEQASVLAEESILLSNVGNMQIEQANKTLISTVKAFGIEVDEQGKNVRKLTDQINEVGNNFAISQEDIAEILRRSSSAMVEAGNTMEEVIALGTGAQEIVQNSAQVGTALKLGA